MMPSSLAAARRRCWCWHQHHPVAYVSTLASSSSTILNHKQPCHRPHKQRRFNVNSTATPIHDNTPTHEPLPTDPYRHTETNTGTGSPFSSTQSSSTNSYQQHQHATEEDEDSSSSSTSSSPATEALKQQILDLALKKVHEYGFTEQAIQTAVIELGYSSAAAGMFPEGAFALVAHFHHHCTEQSLQALTNMSPRSHTTLQRLFHTLETQLKQQLPYISLLPQMLNILLQPSRLSSSWQLYADFADDVWYRLGDTSIDLHWYTKRAYLSTVYASTQLYLSTDRSDGYTETWQFLQRRLDDMQQLQTLPGNIGDGIQQAAGIAYRLIQSIGQQAARQQAAGRHHQI